MKLRLSRRTLPAARRVIREDADLGDIDAPLSSRKERLYRAIEDTQAFLHKGVSPHAVMRDLRRRFPAPLYFVESDRRALERAGLPRLDAFYYAMIPALTRTSLSQQWGMHPVLDNAHTMSEYLKLLYVGIHVECFYLILLDRQCRLIRPALLQRGGVDNAPFYLGQLLTVALGEDARYILLAHNHPRGTPKPSREDVYCTLKALNAFAPLGIPLLDHMIVAGSKVISMRRLGLVPDMLWTAVSPGSKVVKGWLDRRKT